MKLKVAILWLLLSASALAQTHVFPATDTVNVFTNNNTFNRFIWGSYAVANLPSTPVPFMTVGVTDGISATDCTTGHGTFKVTCQWNGTSWQTISGTGNSQVALSGGPYTVATLPVSVLPGTVATVSDGASGTDCTIGLGSTLVTCQWSGSAWGVLSGGGGGGGTVVNNFPKVTHKWLDSFATPIFTASQPACGDLSDSAAGCSATSLPPIGPASGDLSGSFPSPNVSKINGVSLSGLGTGVLKNTTGSGLPSIASASDIAQPFGPSGSKCYLFGGSSGTGCDLSSAGVTTTGSPVSGQGTYLSSSTSITGNPNWLYAPGSGHSIMQGANAQDALFMWRFTDTIPTGNFLHFQNHAKTSDLFTVDSLGNVTTPGILTGGTAASSTCLNFLTTTGTSHLCNTSGDTGNTFTVPPLTGTVAIESSLLINAPALATDSNGKIISGSSSSIANTTNLIQGNGTGGGIASGISNDSTYKTWSWFPGFTDNATSPNILQTPFANSIDTDVQNAYNIQYLPLQLAKIEKNVASSFAVLALTGDSDTSGASSVVNSYVYELVLQMQSGTSGWGQAGPGWVTSDPSAAKNPLPAGVSGTSGGGSWNVCQWTGGVISGGHSGACWGPDNVDITGSVDGLYRSWTATFTDCFLYYAKQPSGGSLHLYIDGSDLANASTSGTVGQVGSIQCPTQTEASHILKAQISGGGSNVTVLGAILIDTTTNGVLVLKMGAGANTAANFALNPDYSAGLTKINTDLNGLTGFATPVTLWQQQWGANEWTQALTTASMLTAISTLVAAQVTANPSADFTIVTDNDDANGGTTNSNNQTLWQYDYALQQYANLHRFAFFSDFRDTYPARTSLCGVLHLTSAPCQRMIASKWLDRFVGHRTSNVTAGTGDSITSPNSTLAVGGTPSATTLDVVGAAGQILAGATPALTATPSLGTDGMVAGTLTLANSAASAHTIIVSGAATTNTLKTFSSAPNNGDLVKCNTASVICQLADSGFLAANVVLASSPAVGIARFAGSTQTETSSELSGDCTTSGSNAVTCTRLNGANFTVNSSGIVTKQAGQTTSAASGPFYVYDPGTCGGTCTSTHASIGSQTMTTVPTGGACYQFSYSCSQVDVGTSCVASSTVTVGLSYTTVANNAVSSSSIVGRQLNTTNTTTMNSNCTLATSAVGAGDEWAMLPFDFCAQAGSTITFSTTYNIGASCSPGPNYNASPFLLLKNVNGN